MDPLSDAPDAVADQAKAAWEAPDVRSLETPAVEAGFEPYYAEGVHFGFSYLGSQS